MMLKKLTALVSFTAAAGASASAPEPAEGQETAVVRIEQCVQEAMRNNIPRGMRITRNDITFETPVYNKEGKEERNLTVHFGGRDADGTWPLGIKARSEAHGTEAVIFVPDLRTFQDIKIGYDREKHESEVKNFYAQDMKQTVISTYYALEECVAKKKVFKL